MYKTCSIVVLIAAFVPSLAAAEVSGRAEIEFFGEQKAIEVQDGYAYTAPDVFDESKMATIVILSDTPIDKAPLVSERDRDSAISSQLHGANANYLEIRVSQEYGLQSVNYVFFGAGNLSKSGTGLGRLTRDDGQRIAGKLSNSTVVFDLPVAAPPELPPATALPADGGAPGEAYRNHGKALAAGDVDTMAKYMAPEKAKEMLASRNDPDFAEQLAFIQEMGKDEVTITGGQQFGDAMAVLKTKGVTEGSPFTGEVTMRRGETGWYIDKESRSY